MSGDQPPTNNQQQPAPPLSSSFSLSEIPGFEALKPFIHQDLSKWECRFSLNGRLVTLTNRFFHHGKERISNIDHEIPSSIKNIDFRNINLPVRYIINDQHGLSNNYYLGDGHYVFDIGGRHIAGGNPDIIVITNEFLSSPSSSLCLDLRSHEQALIARSGASLVIHYAAGGSIQLMNFYDLVENWNEAQFSYRFQFIFQNTKVNIQGEEKIWTGGQNFNNDFYRALVHDPQENKEAFYSIADSTIYAEKGTVILSHTRSYDYETVTKWIVPFDGAYDVYMEKQNLSAILDGLTTGISVADSYKSLIDSWRMNDETGLVIKNTTIEPSGWSSVSPLSSALPTMSLVQLRFKQPGDHKIKLGYIDTNNRLKWWYQTVHVDKSLASQK